MEQGNTKGFNIIGARRVWLTISAVMVAAAVGSMVWFGFRQGIDFTGGTLWQVEFADNKITAAAVTDILIGTGLPGVAVTRGGEGSVIIRVAEINETKHQELANAMRDKLGDFTELSFQSIGPTVGSDLRSKAMWAVLLVLVGISVFVAFAFRKVSQPVQSWKYGLVTLVTLAHDVIIPAGVVAALGSKFAVEADTNFIVALLVIAGFSVHDTIVVFDRIRENLTVAAGKMPLPEIVNRSVNETMARSINTSMTLVFVLAALLLVGPATLKLFILTILIGTVVGTYSSIFVASPLLVIWYERQRRRGGSGKY